MFIFVIALLVLTPPQLAAQLHVDVLRQYIIQSDAAYQNEQDCHTAVEEVLAYTEQQYPLFKFKAEVECYKSLVSPA